MIKNKTHLSSVVVIMKPSFTRLFFDNSFIFFLILFLKIIYLFIKIYILN